MRIAFTSLACPDWTTEEIAAAARRFGYGGVEWRLADGELLGPRTDDAVWERIASCGIEAVCLDTSASFVQPSEAERARAVRHTAAMAARAAQIGAPFVRVFGGAIPEGHVREELLEPTRSALTEAADGLPPGVDILVETHDAWSRASDIAPLVDGIGRVGVLWDVAHTLRAGEQPLDTMRLIGRPGLVHLKDAKADRLTLLGEGDLALADAIDVARGSGYDGWFSFEWEKLWHPGLDDPEVALPHAIAFLEGLSG